MLVRAYDRVGVTFYYQVSCQIPGVDTACLLVKLWELSNGFEIELNGMRQYISVIF